MMPVYFFSIYFDILVSIFPLISDTVIPGRVVIIYLEVSITTYPLFYMFYNRIQVLRNFDENISKELIQAKPGVIVLTSSFGAMQFFKNYYKFTAIPDNIIGFIASE